MPRASSVEPDQRYGKLTTVQRAGKSPQGHIKWQCRCDCGTVRIVFASHLRTGSTKSCGCAMHPAGPEHPQFKGVGAIGGDFWQGFIRNADGRKGRRVLRLAVSQADLWQLFQAQNSKCAYTGLPLLLHPRRVRTASVDRIDSTKGYTRDNVQWVHKDVNRMKNTLTHARFIDLCRRVAQNVIA